MEIGRSQWKFPPIDQLAVGDDLIAVGADLDPATLVEAYRTGYFPMPVDGDLIGWFSPVNRGILPLDGLRVSRSLRRSARRFTCTVDTAFDQVIEACADPGRPMGWISSNIRDAYTRLHDLGVAHSVEVWDDDGLAGGLYGVNVGGLFAGESMFHHRTDASKVALVHLVDLLRGGGDRGFRSDHVLLDVQWATPHLTSLGVIEVDRPTYAGLLAAAVAGTQPPGLSAVAGTQPPGLSAVAGSMASTAIL